MKRCKACTGHSIGSVLKGQLEKSADLLPRSSDAKGEGPN